MSGWDGSNALETQSNLCGYYAFISRVLDELTSLSSLPNVSRSQPSISPFGSYLISASTASPRMLSQVRCRLLEITKSLMQFDRYLLRPYSRRPVLGPPIIFSGISFLLIRYKPRSSMPITRRTLAPRQHSRRPGWGHQSRRSLI